jgi:putative membrane protein
MIDALPVALVVVALALHLVGERRAAARTGRPRGPRARRALAFYAGLATILVALLPPLGTLSAQLFWVQMIQRLLLLMVAAPLIAVSRPWISLWRPFPPRLRHAITKILVQSPVCAPVRRLFGVLARPTGAWLAFNINFVFWHLPGPFDLALRNPYLDALARASFLLFGILFWIQVTGSSRAPSRLTYLHRIGYVASAMVTNVGLAIFLAFAQHPLYAPYAQLTHRPGGISALADQQIGAGIMWAAGDLPFAIALAVLIQRWLAAQETRISRPAGLAVGVLAGADATALDGERSPGAS